MNKMKKRTTKKPYADMFFNTGAICGEDKYTRVIIDKLNEKDKENVILSFETDDELQVLLPKKKELVTARDCLMVLNKQDLIVLKHYIEKTLQKMED